MNVSMSVEPWTTPSLCVLPALGAMWGLSCWISTLYWSPVTGNTISLVLRWMACIPTLPGNWVREPDRARLRSYRDGEQLSAEHARPGFANSRGTARSIDRERLPECFSPVALVYIRWWPELLIGVGVLALAESWFARDHRCSSAARIALIICGLALLVSRQGDFGIYVCGHYRSGVGLRRHRAGVAEEHR